MTVSSIDEGQPVEVRFADRTIQGVVEDVRWRPAWNQPIEEIVVDADGTRIATGRANVKLQ